VNVANRLGVSVFLLAVVVLGLIVALSPAPLAGPLAFAMAVAERRLDTVTQLAVAIGSLAIAVVALVLLVAEWRRPARQTVVVAKVPGGTAELASDSVAMRVKRVAESVVGVRDASPMVKSHGKAIDILLRLSTDADVDLPAKSREVMDAVRAEAETRMGIPVKSLRVTIKHSGGSSRLPAPPSDAIPQ
jgi:hypothetical protein